MMHYIMPVNPTQLNPVSRCSEPTLKIRSIKVECLNSILGQKVQIQSAIQQFCIANSVSEIKKQHIRAQGHPDFTINPEAAVRCCEGRPAANTLANDKPYSAGQGKPKMLAVRKDSSHLLVLMSLPVPH